MRVRRSEVICFCSIQRDSSVTGANAISASLVGNGIALARLRTNASRVGAGTRIDERRRPYRGGRHVGLEGDLARARTSFEQRGERTLPARSRQLAIRRAHRDLHELLGFGERRRRHGRPSDRSGAERGRRAGRGGWRRGRRRWSRRRGRLGARTRGGQHAQGSCDQKLSARVHDASPGYITAVHQHDRTITMSGASVSPGVTAERGIRNWRSTCASRT